MQRGTVKKWDDARGFGFIEPHEGGPDVFCHYTGIDSEAERKSLEAGQTVSFNVEVGPKGKPQATEVKVED